MLTDTQKEQLKAFGFSNKDITNAEIINAKYGIPIADILNKTKTSGKKEPAAGKVAGTRILSAPGSEIVKLNTSTMELMTCVRIDTNKIAYCIVLHNSTAVTKFVTAANEPLYVIDALLFDVLYNLLQSAVSKIDETQRELDITIRERDLYKATIDALRKNGIID